MKTSLLESYYDNLEKHCREKWNSTINEWKENSDRDKFWLVGAANYLFRTGNIRWAIDLSFKNRVIFEKLSPSLPEDLKDISFFLVTHAHQDHFYRSTVNIASQLPAKWVIPEFMTDIALTETSLTRDQIIPVREGEIIEIQGVRIEAYKGMHWEIPGEKGIDSMGYLIETGNRRLLFPGDVRRYETGKIPAFENIDHLIAHVWLGRNNGLHPFPSKELEQFARFVISLRPKKVTLAHLYETDRKPEEIWTYIHGGMIMDVMAAMAPEIDVSISRRWSGYSL